MEPYRDDPSTLPPDCVFANLRACLQAEGPVPDWVFQQVKLIHARRVRLEQQYRMDEAPRGPDWVFEKPPKKDNRTVRIADQPPVLGPRPGAKPKAKSRIVKTTFNHE